MKGLNCDLLAVYERGEFLYCGGDGSILVYNRERPYPLICGASIFWNTTFSGPYKAFIRLDPYYIDTGIWHT